MSSQLSLSEKGNVLFLILLAVALFAALSYAVTSSGRGSGKSANSEAMSADAARVIQWGASAQAQVQRMRLTDNIDELNFGFRVPVDGGSYNCATTNGSQCQFWSYYGSGRRVGGMPFAAVPLKYFVTSISNVNYAAGTPAQTTARAIRVKGIGNDDKADLAIRFFGFTQEFCRELNRQLKLSNIDPVYSESAATPYGGSSAPVIFPEPSGVAMAGDSDASLVGQQMFCARDPSFFGGAVWQLYIILLPR